MDSLYYLQTEVEGNHDDTSHGITSKIDGADLVDPFRQNLGSNGK